MTPAAPTETVPTGRGRPREFDTEAVLDDVVQLFWTKGFEATSVADIVEATGLNKSSLYNAFGSKDALFEQALERYMELRIGMLTTVLTDGRAGLDDLESMFQMMELELDGEQGARGCLAVNTSTELGYRDPQAQDASTRYRSHMRSALSAALARAEGLGEIAPGTAPTYVEILLPWMLGMAVVVRGGAERAELDRQFAAGRALVDSWRR